APRTWRPRARGWRRARRARCPRRWRSAAPRRRRARALCRRSLVWTFVAVHPAQVAVALRHVEAVADDEVGRDGEPNVAQVEVDPLLALLHQQGADLHALGLAGVEVAPQVVQRETAVDDVLDDEDVAAFELGVEVLHDAH